MESRDETASSHSSCLIQEIIESIVTMVAGQAITAVVAEFVPILVICKDVVEVIDKLLDILNCGF